MEYYWIFISIKPIIIQNQGIEAKYYWRCQKIAPGIIYLAGHFLEKNKRLTTAEKHGYSLSKKKTFYKESILYPYVNVMEGNRGLTIQMTDYTEIIYHIEKNRYAHL